MDSQLSAIAESIAAEAPYPGGPKRDFERVGRDALILLLEHGLRPDHYVLDFGCGPLRLGYWLIRLVDPGHYFGIEPVSTMLQPGLRHAVSEDILAFKKPTFSDTRLCEFTVFDAKFDFIVARSIMTHSTPGMLRKVLQSFRDHTDHGSQLFASYWRKGDPFPALAAEDGDALAEGDWRFISHVLYSFRRITEFATEFGLKVQECQRAPINRQIWLRFTR